MAKIDFENIAAPNQGIILQDGYEGLNWDNLAAFGNVLLDEINSSDAIRSGEAAAVTDLRLLDLSSGFESPDRDDNFDFNSGYFTAIGTNDLRVKVVGFDDGERVAKKVLTLEANQEFVRFGREFNDIDEVRFTTDAAYAVDDLSIV